MVEPRCPNLIGYGWIAFRKRQGLLQGKETMVLKLRRIKSSLLMPRKAREKEGSFTTLSTKAGEQVLLQIEGKRRRIYHTYNAIGARNMVIIKTSVLVQTRGSMKFQ